MKELNIDERLAICRKCPIYKEGRCNNKLWINPDTDEVSISQKIGYVRGCNCLMSVKAKNPHNHCVAGKW